jgi:hypothetical protein
VGLKNTRANKKSFLKQLQQRRPGGNNEYATAKFATGPAGAGK